MAEAVERFLAQEEVLGERMPKKGRRQFDCRAAVVTLDADGLALDLVLRHLEPAVRPDDVVTWLRALTGLEPGLNPLVTALAEEGFTEGTSNQIVESFARHFMLAIHSWQENGFGAVAKEYLARLPLEKGVRRDIAENGDLLVRRMGKVQVERKALLPRLGEPAWFDAKNNGPRS